MVQFFESNHVYQHDFKTVSSAYLNRYPNPYANHVLSSDVLQTSIDSDGCLRQTRLVVKTGRLPKFIKPFLGDNVNSWIIEKIVVNPKTQQLKSYTSNIDHHKFIRIEEYLTFSGHDLAPKEPVTSSSDLVNSNITKSPLTGCTDSTSEAYTDLKASHGKTSYSTNFGGRLFSNLKKPFSFFTRNNTNNTNNKSTVATGGATELPINININGGNVTTAHGKVKFSSNLFGFKQRIEQWSHKRFSSNMSNSREGLKYVMNRLKERGVAWRVNPGQNV